MNDDGKPDSEKSDEELELEALTLLQESLATLADAVKLQQETIDQLHTRVSEIERGVI